MSEVEGYLRDLGKTIPSMEGKWDNKKEYERLSIVYTIDGEEQDDNEQGKEKVLVQVINNQGGKVTINGTVGTSKNVTKGSNVTIIVEKEGYRTKTVTVPNIQENYVNTIEFTEEDRLKFTVNVTSNVPDTKILINNREQNSIEVYWGENITIKGTPIGYYSKEQTVTDIRENKNILLEFTEEDRITTKYFISVNCNIEYDSCTINNINTSSAEIYEGQDAAIVVKKEGYYDQQEFLANVRANQTVQINFTDDDKIRSTISFVSNKENCLFKAYDENNNEIPIDNNSVIVDYNGYVKIVASVPDYIDKEKVFNNVREDDSYYFEFTEEDLRPVFRISTDKVNWQQILYGQLQLGVWITLFFKTVAGQGVRLRPINGIVTYGSVNYDSDFDTVDGEQVYKVRINSITPGSTIGFEFYEGPDDNYGTQYGYVGFYIAN